MHLTNTEYYSYYAGVMIKLDLTKMSRNEVYKTKPAIINELRAWILDSTNSIGQKMLENVLQSICIRLAHCQAVNGQQFEHLIH